MAAHPGLQQVGERLQPEEVVLGFTAGGRLPGKHRDGIDQLGDIVGGAAHLAAVAILPRRPAVGALAAHEAVGEEHSPLLVIGLHHRPGLNMPLRLAALPGLAGEGLVFRRVGGVVVIEVDLEVGKILLMGLADLLDQLFRGYAPLLGLEHDCGAVGVIGADIEALGAPQPMVADPDVGLDGLQQMAQMERAIGVGQGAGDQHPALVKGSVGHWRADPWSVWMQWGKAPYYIATPARMLERGLAGRAGEVRLVGDVVRAGAVRRAGDVGDVRLVGKIGRAGLVMTRVGPVPVAAHDAAGLSSQSP